MHDIRTASLDPRSLALLEAGQRDFPLTPRPYAELGARLGMGEGEVLALLDELAAAGVLGRVGAVVAPHRAGWSTLAAMRVPDWALAEVAALVSGYDEVNHAYAREHALNLWFVATGPCERRVRCVLHEIQYRTQLQVIALPLEQAFKLDLGFVA